MKRFFIIVGILLVIAWLQSGLFTVDQAEFAMVARFGDPIAKFDGDRDAGLHFKAPWPIDSVLRVDRRLQTFDLPSTETLTRDKLGRTVDKTIAVDAYICWRVPDVDAMDRFIRTVGTPEQARKLLTPRVTGRLAAVLSNLPLEDVIRVADAQAMEARTEKLYRQVLGEENAGDDDRDVESLRQIFLRDYGIELVEVRLRRFSYPEAVRASIAERIRSERQRKVAEYQSEGSREYTRIVSEARAASAKVIAEAKAKKTRIEGEADAQADAIRNDAHTKDREFYLFLQKLAAYKTMLAEARDVLLLSTKNEFFDMLLKPPKPAQKELPKELPKESQKE